MKFSLRNRTVIDPDGQVHVNPRVSRYSVRLRRENFLPLLIVSLLILGGGVFFAWRAQEFASTANRVQGRVVRVEAVRSKKSTTYKPVVSFQSSNGEQIEFISNISTGSTWSIGDTVSVFYNPKDPHDAVIDSFLQRFGICLVLLVMGSLTMIMAFVALIWNPGNRSVLNINGKEWRNETGQPIGYTSVKSKFGVSIGSDTENKD